MKKVLMLAMVLCMGVMGTSLAGNLLQERWEDPAGSPARDNLDNLAGLQTWMATTPQSKNWPKLVPLLQYPDDGTDYFCSQTTGWLVPPTSGTYNFFLAGDDHSRLWLSSDESPLGLTAVPICMFNGWTGWDEWTKYPDVDNPTWNQKSGDYELVAGQAYWVRALFRDGTGGGNVRVQWQGPGIAQQDIPTQYLRDVVWGAGTPTPKTGSVGFNQGAIALSWADRYDPPFGAIKSWKVYMGTEPNDLTVTLLGTVDEPTRTIQSLDLKYDNTYYWRVDAVVDDANVAKGAYWSVATKIGKPIITTQPVSVYVGVSCSGSFSIVAQSGENLDGGDMTYAWKMVGNATVLGTSASFTTGAEGTYYCEVSNIFGTTKSNEVQLDVSSNHTLPLTPLAIGNSAGVAGTGVTFFGDSKVTVVGSGDDIWNAADGFQYAYTQISGDFDISVRVTNLVAGPDGWTKAGIMCRANTSVNSPFAAQYVTSGNGLRWQGRRADNIAPNPENTLGSGPSVNYTLPVYLRLTRTGDTFNGYYSTDGVTWTVMSGDTDGDPIESNLVIPMTNPVMVGLAITAHDTTAPVDLTASITFDRMSGMGGVTWAASNGNFSPKTPEGWANPVVANTFTWQKATYGPCGATYKLYGGEAADALTLWAETAADVTQATIAANTKITFNKTYFWRVDTFYGGDSEQGPVWTFDSVKQKPLIQSGPAPATVVNAGAAATLNVVATTSTVPLLVEMKGYKWYDAKTNAEVYSGIPEDNDLDGKYNCKLVITNVQQATEASYYCIVENTAGFSLQSPVGWVLTRRLMLYYTFEPSTIVNDIVKDQSASKFDATFVTPTVGNKPAYSLVDSVGTLGKAIKLLGSTDPNGAYLDTGKKAADLGVVAALPRSVSVWNKTSTFNNGGLYDVGVYSSNLQDFAFRTTDNTQMARWRCQFWGSDNNFDIQASLGNWMHSVLVYDGANCALYINGKLLSRFAKALNTANTNNFRIGFYNGNRYIGLLDDLRVYNYALNNQEVGQLYLAGSGSAGPICVEQSVYDFDGNCVVDIGDFAAFSAQWMKSTVIKP